MSKCNMNCETTYKETLEGLDSIVGYAVKVICVWGVLVLVIGCMQQLEGYWKSHRRWCACMDTCKPVITRGKGSPSIGAVLRLDPAFTDVKKCPTYPSPESPHP